jgi:hypothetical protein
MPVAADSRPRFFVEIGPHFDRFGHEFKATRGLPSPKRLRAILGR